jgi:spore coat assembly protein
MGIKVGDIVARKSYGYDILFKVHEIAVNKDGSRTIYLKGLNYRLFADAPESDLAIIPINKINDENSLLEKRISKLSKKNVYRAGGRPGKHFLTREEYGVFEKPGKVLHVDGDNDYLNMCMKYYKEQGINAVGKVVKEVNSQSL